MTRPVTARPQGPPGLDGASPAVALSVVVPTHQTRELTLRCLTALLAAVDPSESEVVVVDDGSTDGTAETVSRRFPNAVLLRNETATGFTAAANRGVAASRGALVLLLNSDTEVAADGIGHLVAAFRRHPELGVAGGRLLYPDGTPQWSHGGEPGIVWCFALASGLGAWLGRRRWWRRLRPSRRAGGDGSAYRPVGWVTGAALAFRRQVWVQAGPLHEGFRFYGQDLDFCLRARDAGWAVGTVAGFVVLHHHGATIGRVEPSRHVLHQDPALLWTDLVRWAERRGGVGRARRIARALRAGVRLRLLTRRLVATLRPAALDARWEQTGRALAHGREALDASLRRGRSAAEEGGPPSTGD